MNFSDIVSMILILNLINLVKLSILFFLIKLVLLPSCEASLYCTFFDLKPVYHDKRKSVFVFILWVWVLPIPYCKSVDVIAAERLIIRS